MSEDRIILQDLTFYGYHGVNPEERTLGQRFVVDVALSLDLRAAGHSDDLTQTVSYSRVYQVVRRIAEGPAFNLIEAVAERIAEAVLAECGGESVQVRVSKPWAPLRDSATGRAAVEIVRHR